MTSQAETGSIDRKLSDLQKKFGEEKKAHGETMSFPLFRLPYLAIVQVFKNMSHETLFLLPISTKRAKDLIRTYLPKQFLTADFHFCHLVKVIPNNGPGHFRIHGLNTDEWPKKAIRCRIGNEIAAVNLAMGQIDFYWSRSDLNFALSSFISHIYVYWNCPKISITYNNSYALRDFSCLIEELKRNNLEIESICFPNGNFFGDELEKLLVECKEMTSKLIIDAGKNIFFENRHVRGFISVNELEIKNCRWVFLEDFMECKSIKIECGKIRNDFGVYIKTFIQKWMNDYECQLKIVTITNCPFTFEQVTNGLRHRSSHCVEGISMELQQNNRKHILVTLNGGVLKIELMNTYNIRKPQFSFK